MADDDIDYIDDLLDAPFKQQNDANNGKRRSESIERRETKKSRRGSSKDVEHRSSSHKASRRSRSKDRRRSKDKKSSRDEEKPKKDKKKSRSRSKERRRKSRSRSAEKVKKRSRSKDNDKRRDDRDKEGDRRRDRGDRVDRDRERDRVEKVEKRRSKTPDRSRRRRSFSPRPFRRGRTPPNGITRDSLTPEELSPEERDARTIFCMQLSQRVKARDLEEFFSSVGKVRDVRLITCNKTKRFKGIAYVEFRDPESVALSLGLSGQKLYGIPISVQHTQAEKNRLANKAPSPQPAKNIQQGPTRLYVGSLHFQVTEEMLGDIFKPFGRVTNIQLIKDPETGHSKGYGFITYQNDEDAKEALVQLNGFELAGRPMKVGNVTERLDATHASLDTDEMDRSGIDLGTTGRLQLMVKLAEKTDLEIPQVTANALMASAPQPTQAIIEEVETQVATQCFLLVNMFDPATETDPSWDQEIKDDVIEECNKHGGVLHVFVDTASPEGKVYVKCPSKATAVLAVNALHGRWFAGRVIAAAYVPLSTYHLHFPESVHSSNLLQMKRV